MYFRFCEFILSKLGKMEMCRCCLSEGNIGLNSFTDKNIVEILEFLGIIFKIQNNLPKNICNSCDLKLKEFADFRQLCLQTEITLKDLFQTPNFIKKEDGCENVLPNLQENSSNVGIECPQTRRSKRLSKNLESPKLGHQYEEVKKEEIPLLETFGNDREFAENLTEQHGKEVEKTKELEKSGDDKKCLKNFDESEDDRNEVSNSEDYSISDHSMEDDDDNLNLETSTKFTIKRNKKTLTRTYNPKIKHKFPFQCHICNRGFIYQELFDGHLREHEGGSAAICEYCNNGYSNMSGLRKHIRICHMNEMKYRCDCGKAFILRSAFERHQTSHYGRRKYICETCGKSFREQCLLQKHLLVHTDERPFQCKNCDKAFKSAQRLREHEFRHTGIRKYVCQVCAKPFVTSPELKSHMLVHTLVKAYKCTFCEKDFRYKNQLDVHMRTHTGEEPFKCEICGKTFAQNSALKTHSKIHLINETFLI